MDQVTINARPGEKHLRFGIWFSLCMSFDGTINVPQCHLSERTDVLLDYKKTQHNWK